MPACPALIPMIDQSLKPHANGHIPLVATNFLTPPDRRESDKDLPKIA